MATTLQQAAMPVQAMVNQNAPSPTETPWWGAAPTTTPITTDNMLRGQMINFNLPAPTPVSVAPLTTQFNLPAVDQLTTRFDLGVDPSQLTTQFDLGPMRQLTTDFQFDASAPMIEATFQRLLPQLQQQLQEEARALAAQTAGLGRTGSGMFTRSANELTERSLAQREALLGNLAFQAHQADLNRAVQAAQLKSEAERAMLAGETQRALALANLQAEQERARLSAQQTQAIALANLQAEQERAMMMARQQQALALAELQALQERTRAQLGLQADMFNVGNTMQHNLLALNHLLGERDYQDRLAREATQDELARLNLLANIGFYDPTSALLGAGQLGLGGAATYSGNVDAINALLRSIGAGIGGSLA